MNSNLRKTRLNAEQLQQIAEILGGCVTGHDIDETFDRFDIADRSRQSTKWRRLDWAFNEMSQHQGHFGLVWDLIQTMVSPIKYSLRPDEFESRRKELNTVLAFSGLEYGADGQFVFRTRAKTLDEAARRSRIILEKFANREIHPEVLKYCSAELMEQNYFHAVFEAAKGLLERVRNQSGVNLDGERLVQTVFMSKEPIIAFNALETDTDRSEQRGFAYLLLGCVSAIRNPLAHEPKILWDGENDAADYLGLISLLHKKLDEADADQN